MPTFNNYMALVYINLAFLTQLFILAYYTSILEIKKNWSKYRCNPSYWLFSPDIAKDFIYCVQNTQMNFMSVILRPIIGAMSAMSDVGSGLASNVNDLRTSIGNTRTGTASITGKTFGVFNNMTLEFQKMGIGMKDMMGKMVGVVTTILYIMDGTQKTTQSAWKGPTGLLVRKIGSFGSCFHPSTIVRLRNGKCVRMENLQLGDILDDGAEVECTMEIANTNPDKIEPLMVMKGQGLNGSDIYVTGSHYILNKINDRFVKVMDHPLASKQSKIASDKYLCLMTSNCKISIGDCLFWDWNDDVLTDGK